MKMKRFFGNAGLFRGILAAIAFAAALLALTGCSNPNDGDETPSLIEIKVETTKNVYIAGEELDLATITVTGVYSDGSEKIIAITGDNISGYVSNQPGTCNVTITVEGKTAAFQATVQTEQTVQAALEAAIEKALDDIDKIAVSAAGDGSDIPSGVKWITPGQKQALQDAVAAAQAASGAGEEELAAALNALEEAIEEFNAASENQKGTEAEESYTVTFNNNGGEGVNPATKTVTSPATTVDSLPAPPTRSNYTFRGWNTEAGGTGTPFIEATTVTDDITVYAQWTADYDISLDQTGLFVFPKILVGYGAPPEAKSITIANTGAKATGDLTVALTGAGLGSFTLSATSISSIAVSGNAVFTVVPNAGLAEGTYTATVTVSGGNGITASFDVSFKVAPALTGTVSISGLNYKVWSTLTADTGGLGGSGAIACKWQRGDTQTGAFANIGGAASSVYRLELADQGKYIRVEVSRTENAGTITSNTIGPVEAPPSGATNITIGFDYGDITVGGSDGTNLIYKTTTTPNSITLTVTGYTDVQWYSGGNPVAPPEGNADSITLNAGDYAAGEYSITFTGKRGSVLFSKLIPFTVQN
jgi:uncharacterized repeat protein (TIGR02543 family)